ncbi:hypothetical protein RJT34_11889 [Clitoria ternatea]|uniref:Uncharacterized protein n=1 Tax=Clitoria ternatea TaxID=43366 RepID=A0AAN9JMR8_CLITE
MAEALLGSVFDNSLSLAQNEFATFSGIREKADKLSSTLELIKAVLEDAEDKQITNPPIKVWLQQLKDATYVLDDILDQCSIQAHRLGGSSSFHPKNILFRRQLGSKLKEITKRFDDIAEAKNKFLLQEGVRERASEVAEWRQTTSIINQPRVYGRYDDKEKIVEFLLSRARESDLLSIYPIVGLGGVGKTTLAQFVYNDERVTSHFNIEVWVCVSESFSTKRILCCIIESISREKYDSFHLDVIERKVQELLQSKRYLLVLDDVWKQNHGFSFGLNQDKWNKLKSVLSCGSKGASILVSTRDKNVATMMGTCQAHGLNGLSEDDCWLLFKQYAFGVDKEERAELVSIGREIVKKCKGSPLAAQALGSLLRPKSEEREWFEVKESSLWDLEGENSILPALRLSYSHLTSTLKQCFSFCAIFPKDSEIGKEQLIHLWMANGFISSRGSLEVEDVGNIIWNELCQKSFFQDIKRDDYSGNILFKMHDLVHDLAQSVMKQECVILGNSNITDFSRNTHHVSFDCDSSPFNKGVLPKFESLRTLYALNCWSYYREISSYCSTNCSLRVLRIYSDELLKSLGNLIHLRYLELHGVQRETLPDSIYSLRKLEILKLNRVPNLRCLPKHLSRLQNLRHLVIEGCLFLSCMFPNVRKLWRLKTLSFYIVSSKKGHRLEELHDLQLRGKLKVKGLENVNSSSEAQEANLLGKKDLEELWLSWDDTETKPHNELVLEGLQPHSNLKKLTIRGYEGLQLPSWIENLTNLVDLHLGCKNCEPVKLPSLGKLPFLRKLSICGMQGVEYLDDDDGVEVWAFPSLEKLGLNRLPELKQLLKVERGNMFLHLSDLTIDNCPKLVLPCLPSIRSLTVVRSSNELLRSISSFHTLVILDLIGDHADQTMTSFPEGIFRNFTCLKTLHLQTFSKLKELPYELFYLNTLEYLHIGTCHELECLPELVWEGLHSLRTLLITHCKKLRCLPESIRQLTSLKFLQIVKCPTIIERCEKGKGEDWDKIAHVPNEEKDIYTKLQRFVNATEFYLSSCVTSSIINFAFLHFN